MASRAKKNASKKPIKKAEKTFASKKSSDSKTKSQVQKHGAK